ncbi:hypothetical protein DM860_013416 [Cuscuta australis]|uniref:Wall-associated receptor kinase galacturonan-binding domain-containing protein n=1 Tax=Cuscuta australis TaxID=267555 RepID=A0A328DTM2_9ASTE|nr:hypothetical protein DM860_013416 [Cuscuta australis]
MMLITILIITTTVVGAAAATPCRDSCGGDGSSGDAAIKIKYPFGIDGGCGAPQYAGMLDCRNTTAGRGLFLLSGGSGYKVQGIDYEHRVMTIQDTSIPTCLNPNTYQQQPQQHTNNNNNTAFLLINSDLIAPS